MRASQPSHWTTARLGDIAEVQLGKMLSAKARGGSAARPYLRNVNVRWHRIDVDDVLTMNFEAREVNKYTLRRGDVLVCEGGEPGRAAIWSEQLPGALYQKALHRVRFNDTLFDPRLLTFWLEQEAAFGGLARRFTGSTIKHLPREVFLEMQVPVPPLGEQRCIVAALEERLSDLDAAERSLRHAVGGLNNFRVSVLNAAFEGRLQVRATSAHKDWREVALGDAIASATIGLDRGRNQQSTGRRWRAVHQDE